MNETTVIKNNVFELTFENGRKESGEDIMLLSYLMLLIPLYNIIFVFG